MEAAKLFSPNDDQAEHYRQAGFGSVLTHQQDGLVRSTASLVDLSGRNANESVMHPSLAAAYSFDKGVSSQEYPSSLMGSIALIRQTLLDAEWYADAHHMPGVAYNASLEAMQKIMAMPAVFQVNNKLSALRAAKIAREFNLPWIIKGNGDEFQQLDALLDADLPLIIPMDFPAAFDVSDPFAMEYISWADLKHWEVAPFNPRILHENGITYAITMEGCEKPEDFLKNIRKAVRLGLADSAALQALTSTPAQLVNMDNLIGTLASGKWANFLITDRPVFDSSAVILENWSRGHRFVISESPAHSLAGSYQLLLNGDTATFALTVKDNKLTVASMQPDSIFKESTIKMDGNVANMTFEKTTDSTHHTFLLTGMLLRDGGHGKYQDADGNFSSWRAGRIEVERVDSVSADSVSIPEIPSFRKYPFHGYGFDSLPVQQKFLVRNATVWTNEDQGIVENTDVLIESGIIASIGTGLDTANAIVIDGTGMHLTSGIIDEHSHMAISRGVNEASHTSTAEVRIGDVINSTDVNIYRQLAGGVTASQLLHGSANPIGGQSALIKLRWGWGPEAMKFSNAAPFIKFALGENVKQSNWGDEYKVRYPQTRMGVEQVFYDYFLRAEAYLNEWEEYESLSSNDRQGRIPPRKDLQMEALGEVLNGERFITCHSYVQSEINMLMHVADSLGITVNTFTHILEGYKVASKMKAHGAGASTFSDRWAYKYEVIDAIPYNAAILARAGVVTAINSDNQEMGRRLNQEAAKSIKYGGLPDEEAWKLVTLNPAKLLQVDHRTGSVKVGKDADLVLWTDHPLSVYAKTQKTFVDGRLMYDRERNKNIHIWLKKDRQRLIQAMMNDQEGEGKKPEMKLERNYECNDMDDVFQNDKP